MSKFSAFVLIICLRLLYQPALQNDRLLSFGQADIVAKPVVTKAASRILAPAVLPPVYGAHAGSTNQPNKLRL